MVLFHPKPWVHRMKRFCFWWANKWCAENDDQFWCMGVPSNSLNYWYFGWLCFTSHLQRGQLETTPHLLSLGKDMKLGFFTIPTGNLTLGCRVAVHYTTSASGQLLNYWKSASLIFFPQFRSNVNHLESIYRLVPVMSWNFVELRMVYYECIEK